MENGQTDLLLGGLDFGVLRVDRNARQPTRSNESIPIRILQILLDL